MPEETEPVAEADPAPEPPRSRLVWLAQFLGVLVPVLLLLRVVTGQWFPPGGWLVGLLAVAVVEAVRRRRR